MRKRIVSLLIACMMSMTTLAFAQQVQETTEIHESFFQLGILTYFGPTFDFDSPLGTNGNASPFTTNTISLNILGGYSYGNTLLEIGGLYNINTNITKGLQIAGFSNYSGNAHNAFQIAGVMNATFGGNIFAQISSLMNIAKDVQGLQIGGGLLNGAMNDIQGLQIGGGLLNFVANDVQGVQIGGGLANFTMGDVQGAQIGGGLFNGAGAVQGVQIGGGLFNVAGTVQGVQIGGGILNFAFDVKGIQIGGIFNDAGIFDGTDDGGISGVQIGAISNFAAKVNGVQISALFNFSRELNGVQIGLVNYTDEINGAQIGLVNYTEEIRGVQIGLVNYTEEINGAQIGLVNYTDEITGLQIGLANYTEEINGLQIGLVNIVKNGGKIDFELSVSDSFTTALSFKSGTDYFYTIVSAGINYLPTSSVEYAWGLGIGTDIDWIEGWGNQIELLGYTITENGEYPVDFISNLYQLKLTVSKEFSENFELFAGPVLNLSVSNYKNPQSGDLGSSLPPWSMWHTDVAGSQLNSWVGGSAGMRFSL